MPRFTSEVVRHGDAAAPHYSVRFLGGDGETVTVELHLASADGDPDRQTVLDAARAILARLVADARDSRIDQPRSGSVGSPSAGLSRAASETEADTHGSDGRDTGTA